MRSLVIALSLVAAATGSATAERWYQGPHGKNRVIHVSLTVGLGVVFVATETLLKPSLAPDPCRWCAPPGLDVSVRDALLWDDAARARSLSNLTGYVGAPALALGVTGLTALAADDAGWARLIDDTIPVLETVAISQAVTQVVKFSVGRQRPFARYGTAPVGGTDDNMSFYSGHAALAFSITTSAAMVAHWRRSRAAPVIWVGGGALSVATAYLRIAGDKHYLTDVVTGSIVGVAAGLTIPRLMRRHGQIAIVPAPGGVSIAGAF